MSLAIPMLETPRLQLIAPAESHLDVFAEMYGDPECMAHIRGGQTFDRVGSWGKIAIALGHFQLRGYGFWSVQEKATGQIVGHAGLMFPAGAQFVEIGWLIAKGHWGKGYATEAAQAALKHALEVVKTERVVAHIAPANLASLAVAQKLGMVVDQQASNAEATIYAICHTSA